MNFLERFKGKTSKIGRQGNIDSDSDKRMSEKRSFDCADESTRKMLHPSKNPITMQKSGFDFSGSLLDPFPTEPTLLNQSEREEDKSSSNIHGGSATGKQEYVDYLLGNSNKRNPVKAIRKQEQVLPGKMSSTNEANALWNRETIPKPYKEATKTINEPTDTKEGIIQSGKPTLNKETYPLAMEARKPPIQRDARMQRRGAKDAEQVDNYSKLKDKKLEILTGSELDYNIPSIARTNKSVPAISTTKPYDTKNNRVLKNAAYHYLSSSKPWYNLNTHRNEQERQNTSQSDSSNVSMLSAPSSIKYRPYGLNEYKEIRPKKYYTLGGLGANLGGKDWEKSNEKARRMQEYARNVKELNKDLKVITNYTRQTPEREAALQMRQKMLDYARHIPKPKLQQINEVDEGLIDTLKDLNAREGINNPFLKGFNCDDNLIYS